MVSPSPSPYNCFLDETILLEIRYPGALLVVDMIVISLSARVNKFQEFFCTSDSSSVFSPSLNLRAECFFFVDSCSGPLSVSVVYHYPGSASNAVRFFSLTTIIMRSRANHHVLGCSWTFLCKIHSPPVRHSKLASSPSLVFYGSVCNFFYSASASIYFLISHLLATPAFNAFSTSRWRHVPLACSSIPAGT